MTITSSNEISSFIENICETFQCRGLRNLSYFLVIQCIYQGENVVLSQERSIRDILKKFGYAQSNLIRTPMTLSTKLQHDMGSGIEDVTKYRGSSLQYLTLIRPDHLNKVCQFLQNPKKVILMQLSAFLDIYKEVLIWD